MSAQPSLLSQPVTHLKGIGAQLANKLAKLGITELQDLLFHLPLRYQNRTHLTPIGQLKPQQDAVIQGEVYKCDVVYGKRRSLLCMLQDDSGRIALRFFHFSQAQKQNLSPGTPLRCYGEVRRGSSGLEIYHPETHQLAGGEPEQLPQTLTPIYPNTEGLSQTRLRKIIQQVLEITQNHCVEELIPGFLSSELPFHQSDSSLNAALQFLHAPPKNSNVDILESGQHPAQLRLAFEELLAHRLSLLQLRAKAKLQHAIALPKKNKLIEQFLQQLPFTLTAAQQTVTSEIQSDLASPHPMTRLLQGDVGSGKTIVAALAALQAIANGKQVALMAPTEILAAQHYTTLSQWFKPLNIGVAWLSGRQKISEKKYSLSVIASGEAGLVVGTHALIQADVEFDNLCLIIVDEQHRFGVEQRLTLRNKGIHTDKDTPIFPHQLIMTATPIPRTLAMSVYADMDVSVIDELPPGRTPVSTVLIANDRRKEVIERIRSACGQGRQAYWVCTLIEDSESLEAQAAETTAQELQQALPNMRIELVHSRIKSDKKDEVMANFKGGTIDLLVATTVIEVGVDVPNASLMIIENPERLGLAQLHQLRGRVGRGRVDSHCVLLYGSPLSLLAKQRLQVLRGSNDGFYIAEEDLKIRGPGEVLGTRQTGTIEFKVADLQHHAHLHQAVKNAASKLLSQQSPVTEFLIKRWLGTKPNYAQA